MSRDPEPEEYGFFRWCLGLALVVLTWLCMFAAAYLLWLVYSSL